MTRTHKFLSPLFGLAFTATAFLVPAAAYGGLILEQTMEGSEAPSHTTMRIQDGKIRTDVSEELSTIADTKAGEVMTIMHPAKMVTVLTQPKNGAAAPKTPDMPTPKYKVTGLTEKVNGYDCNIVTMEIMDMKSTFWVAKSYPDYDKIKAEMATIKPVGVAPETPKELDGLILKTSTIGPKYLSIVTVKSVKIEEIPAEVFQAPAGYTVSRPEVRRDAVSRNGGVPLATKRCIDITTPMLKTALRRSREQHDRTSPAAKKIAFQPDGKERKLPF